MTCEAHRFSISPPPSSLYLLTCTIVNRIMMSHVSNTNQSSLMCPTIAWTPTPRSCMELSQPIAGFRHNTLSSSNANHSLLQPSSSPVAASAVSTEPPAFCVTSNAHHQSGPVSGQLSPQSLQHSPSQHQPHGQVSPPHGQVSPPPCTAPMSSRVSWMVSEMEYLSCTLSKGI